MPADAAPGAVLAETSRLILRHWRLDDAAALAAMNADPVVMRFVGGPMARLASDEALTRMIKHWESYGYGHAAVQTRNSGELIGFAGLGSHVAVPGATEIGWRLAARWWGHGYASEAAAVMRDLAFDGVGLDRLVSVARPDNPASLGVMRNIGMRHWQDLPLDGQMLTIFQMRPEDRPVSS